MTFHAMLRPFLGHTSPTVLHRCTENSGRRPLVVARFRSIALRSTITFDQNLLRGRLCELPDPASRVVLRPLYWSCFFSLGVCQPRLKPPTSRLPPRTALSLVPRSGRELPKASTKKIELYCTETSIP